MQIFYTLDACHLIKGSFVALGNFDGVHIGHQEVIKKAVEEAKRVHLSSVVFTFRHHPSKIVSECEVEYLTPFEEKSKILENLGVDCLVALDFTQEFASMSREAFFEMLKEKLLAKGLSVGYNYRFGKGRLGDVEFLKNECDKSGINLNVAHGVAFEGESVSSSKIRNLLKDNNIELVNKLLGRPFQIEGIVIHGRKLGRAVLGFPTANVQEQEKLLPKNGVFGVKVRIEGDLNFYYGVMNVGNNPTMNAVMKQSVEVHIFDFDQDIYGKWIHVEVLEFLRKEEKLNGLEALKVKINQDVEGFKVKVAQNYKGVKI